MKSRQTPKPWHDEVRAMAAKGVRRYSIALHFGVKTSHISWILDESKRERVRERNRIKWERVKAENPKKPRKQWWTEAERLRSEGVTLREIGQRLNVNASTVAYALFPKVREYQKEYRKQRYEDLKAYGKRDR